MICSKCGNELDEEMFSNGICFTCGYPTAESEKAFKIKQNELKDM